MWMKGIAMSDQDDGMRNLSLAVVAGVVVLVLAVAIVIAATSAQRHLRAMRAVAAPDRTAYGPVESLYFPQGGARLNAGAVDALHRVAQAARNHPRAAVRIAASELRPVEANADPQLAQRRTLAVRHALEAAGVAPDRITTLPLIAPAPADDARQTRRVEVRLE